MDAIHIHFLVNHVPILGTVFALVLGVAGLALRQPVLTRAAFVGFVVVGAASLVATKSGEEAEHRIENLALPGVTESVVHAHEDAAEVATYAALALAVAALVALAFGWSQPPPAWTAALVLAGALVVGGLMARAGALGGEIRHTEIRAGAGAASGGPDGAVDGAIDARRDEPDDD